METPISAVRNPALLASPDIVHVGVKDALSVRGGASVKRPPWATTSQGSFELAGPIVSMLGVKDGQKGELFTPKTIDLQKRGLDVYLKAVGTTKGVVLEVEPGLIQKLTERVTALIDKAKVGLTKLGGQRAGARNKYELDADLGADGVKLSVRAAPGLPKSWVRYGWGSLLSLVTAGVDAAGLIPDDLAIHTSALALTKERDKAAEAKRPDGKTWKFTELPGLLQQLFGAFGVQAGDEVIVPLDQGAIDGQGWVTLRAYHVRGGQVSAITVALPIDALVAALVPEFVLKKLRAKKKARKGLGVRYVDDRQDPPARFEVSVGDPKAQRSVYIVTGWTVQQLVDAVLHFDKVVEDPLSIAPTTFKMSVARSKFRIGAGIQSGAWTPAGRKPIDLGPLDGFKDALLEMIGAGDATLYGEFSPAELASRIKDAPSNGGWVDIGGCFLVAEDKGDDGEQKKPTVLSATLGLHWTMAVKLARAMPYAGFLVRALEAVKYLIENWEDLKNAPEALYELAKALPSIGRMLARVDWSSVEWGKTLTALVMADIPNFAEIKQIARFAREADAKGLLPDEIKGSELYQAIMNTDSASAIASALEKMGDKEREALLDALKKGKREGLELPDDVEAFLLDKARVAATAKDLRDLEAMEGDLQALGTASATAQAIGAAGGSDAAAGSAFQQAREAEALGGSEGEREKRQQDIVWTHLKGVEPYTTLEKAARGGAYDVDTLYALVTRYAPMSKEQLLDVLASFSGDQGGLTMLAQILAWKAGVITNAADLAKSADASTLIELSRAAVTQDGLGIAIDIRKAARANPQWHAKIGFDPEALLSLVEGRPAGIPASSAVGTGAFAVGIAMLQTQLGGLAVDGIAGPLTVKRALEKRHGKDRQALRKAPGYSKALEVLAEQAEQTRRAKPIDEATIELEDPALSHPVAPPRSAWRPVTVVVLNGEEGPASVYKALLWTQGGRTYYTPRQEPPPLEEFTPTGGGFYSTGEKPAGTKILQPANLAKSLETVPDPPRGMTAVLRAGTYDLTALGLSLHFPADQAPQKTDHLEASTTHDFVGLRFTRLELAFKATGTDLIVGIGGQRFMAKPGEYTDVIGFDTDIFWETWLERNTPG